VTDAHDVIDIALRVAAAIESSGGAYFIGGSVASSLQGDPRATNDIDVVLSLPALTHFPQYASSPQSASSAQLSIASQPVPHAEGADKSLEHAMSGNEQSALLLQATVPLEMPNPSQAGIPSAPSEPPRLSWPPLPAHA
jgi:hypothetical protein